MPGYDPLLDAVRRVLDAWDGKDGDQDELWKAMRWLRTVYRAVMRDEEPPP
jgi:hypothetical protein